MPNTSNSSILPDEVLPSDRVVWIFQCNPKFYKMEEALLDEEVTQCLHWRVNQHENKIAKGHLGIIWCSGPASGIYAITELISDPGYFVESDHERRYWIDPIGEQGSQYRVKMKIVRNLVNAPIARGLIKNTEGLQHLSIIRMPQGTNFKVTASEWEIIKYLINTVTN